jgi:hypothetical protein
MLKAVKSESCRAPSSGSIPRESNSVDASKMASPAGSPRYARRDWICRSRQRSNERLERFHLAYAEHREDACTQKLSGKLSEILGLGGMGYHRIPEWKWVESGQFKGWWWRSDAIPSRMRKYASGKPLPASCRGRVGSGEPGAQTTFDGQRGTPAASIKVRHVACTTRHEQAAVEIAARTVAGGSGRYALSATLAMNISMSP